MPHIRRPMEILSILLTVVLVAVSVLIVLVVLIQRPKQEGLGAAFGGSTLDSALGAHTTDVLQKITTWLGIIFFVSAIALAMIKTRQFKNSASSNVLEEVQKQQPKIPQAPSSLPSLPTLPKTGDNNQPAPQPAPQPAVPATPKTTAPAADKKSDTPRKSPQPPKIEDKKAKAPAPKKPAPSTPAKTDNGAKAN